MAPWKLKNKESLMKPYGAGLGGWRRKWQDYWSAAQGERVVIGGSRKGQRHTVSPWGRGWVSGSRRRAKTHW